MQASNITHPAEPESKFEFVVGSVPQELRVHTSRRFRSYLSKRAWMVHRAQNDKKAGDPPSYPPSSSSSASQVPSGDHGAAHHGNQAPSRTTRRRRTRLQTVTFEYIETCGTESPPFAWDAQATTSVRTFHPQDALLQLLAQSLTGALPVDAHGGMRVDPFRSYPGPWQPYIPALADHYIVQMAHDIPELDQPGNKGLLRTRWFPLVLSSNALFQVIMLLSAANYASVNSITTMGCHILRMKHDAISAINLLLQGGAALTLTTDCLIGAVAKMASFEAMHGDVRSYRMHMGGLVRMVELRGGLDALGLGGLLRRMVVWIDLNSSFLLQVERYFPGATFTGVEGREVVEVLEPNPERFIAV